MRTLYIAAVFGLLLLGAGTLAAQATHLAVTTTIADTQANATIASITVEAQDAGNGLDNTYNTTINVNLSGGTGALGGTTTGVTMTNGVATFANLTIDQVGAKQLTFVDQSGTPLTSGMSNAFNITADRLIITTAPTNTMANATMAGVVVEARDGAGNTDTTFTGSISAALASGSGSLTGGGATAATAGVVTFSGLSIDQVGAKTLAFTATGLTTATSASFNITADRLIFTTQPANTTAGQTMANVVVEARDGSGNTDTTFAGSIALTLSPGTGTLNGTTSVAATSGVATFSTLSINEANTYTLDADSGALTTGTSVSFDITPDADDHLAFLQQPTTATVSTVITPAITVQILDQFDNLTSSAAMVTLTINNNPGSANLGGTNMQAASAGVATFNDITLDAAGANYTLDADATALTGDTSAQFDITANPAPTITVTAGGNPVTNSGTVNVLTGSTVTAANISITVNDSSTGDSLALTANITNQGTTGIVISEWQGSSTSPTAITANPSTGTFNTATTLAVTLTANDGVNAAVTFDFDIVVSNAPTITVNSPNGGENFTVGGNLTVTWSSSGVAGTVDIMLSTNSGGAYSVTLASGTANDGSETITVPSNPATTCRVRVRDSANPGTTFDDSNADFTIATPAPAAGTLSSHGNPGQQNANPGSTRTALGFRITETGGGSTLTVTGITVRITLANNAGGVAEAAVSSITLRRGGSALATQTNANWSANSTTITCNFNGLSEAITASGTGDFSVTMTFAGTSVPTPHPQYSAQVTTADISSASTIGGVPVGGGAITLIDALPDDPLDDTDDDDSCDLATHGGPAWPLAFIGLFLLALALRRRREAN